MTLHDKNHNMLYNMTADINLGKMDWHYNQLEAMLKAGFRLWWETSDWDPIQPVEDPPAAGRYGNLVLIDAHLVQNPRDAAFFIRQMDREERYDKRPDGLAYSYYVHQEMSSQFATYMRRIKERDNGPNT